MTDLAAVRRDYARKVMAHAGVSWPALEDAFATIPREAFMSPGPWSLFSASGVRRTRNSDPTCLYDDVLVALAPEKLINNGQPSGHALWLHAAGPRQGDHVVHVGAGTGYYTAILARLAGPSGCVTAIELDRDLAGRARENLKSFANVTVLEGDGSITPFAAADVIYVNAGVTRPADIWLDGLTERGRLLMPLTASAGPGQVPRGVMFRFERRGEAFLACAVSPSAFIPFEGLREPASDAALARAFATGDVARVSRLVRQGDWPDENVWLRGPGWTLLYR